MLESKFVRDTLKPELEARFPGIEIIKMDANQKQGSPDHLLLYEDKWAMLESKNRPNATQRPNQEYYVNKYNEMSFAAFVNPQNYHEVLDDLQQAFRPEG